MKDNMFHETEMKITRSMFTPKRKAAPLDWGALQAIVDWLNQPKRDEGQGKVGEAINLLQEMDQLWLGRGPAWPDSSPEGRKRREYWKKLRAILDDIEPAPLLSLMMRPSQWRKLADLTAGLGPLKIRVLPSDEGHVLDLKWVRAPEYGFMLLSQITKANLLGNLRQCKRCSLWYAATKNRQTFCSADCQAAFWEEHRKSEKGLAEMRIYMRRHRRKLRQSRKGKRT